MFRRILEVVVIFNFGAKTLGHGSTCYDWSTSPSELHYLSHALSKLNLVELRPKEASLFATHRVGTVGHTLGSKIDRVAEWVIQNPLVSVIIDLLMKFLRSFSAISVDWKFGFRDPTVATHLVGFCRVFTTRKSYEDSVALSWDLAQVDQTRKGFSTHIQYQKSARSLRF